MKFPPFPEITAEHLSAIAERHALGTTAFTELPQVGIFNKIYQIGEAYILRIARDHPRTFTIAHTEAIAVPLARKAGVSAPELIVMDDSCEILTAPYTIYERVKGETLGLLDLEPHDVPEAWRAVGRDLARLHLGVTESEENVALPTDTMDPRPWPDELAAAGYFTAMEARWFSHWLEALEPAINQPIAKRFTHGDMQAHNIMVSADSHSYLALIDWAFAGWRDPTNDFGGVPLRAVPYMLEGYRTITPLEQDESAEARILWRSLTLVLHNLWRDPEPELAWAERPLTFLIELIQFLQETEDKRWRELWDRTHTL